MFRLKWTHMNSDKSVNYSRRFQELQEKFRSLEPRIENSETKEALSIMSGMIQEVWRQAGKVLKGGESNGNTGGVSLKQIAELYRNAPKMNSPAINTPLPDGTVAPDFSLKDADGQLVNLSGYKGSPVLLVFYPLDWSPGCSQQLDLYQQEWNEFEKRGINVLGISVDSLYSHGAWAMVRKIGFPLLSDFNPKGETAEKYNVYRREDGFSERALYVVDSEGVIRYGFISPFLHHIPDIYQLFEKIDKALKGAKA